MIFSKLKKDNLKIHKLNKENTKQYLDLKTQAEERERAETLEYNKQLDEEYLASQKLHEEKEKAKRINRLLRYMSISAIFQNNPKNTKSLNKINLITENFRYFANRLNFQWDYFNSNLDVLFNVKWGEWYSCLLNNLSDPSQNPYDDTTTEIFYWLFKYYSFTTNTINTAFNRFLMLWGGLPIYFNKQESLFIYEEFKLNKKGRIIVHGTAKLSNFFHNNKKFKKQFLALANLLLEKLNLVTNKLAQMGDFEVVKWIYNLEEYKNIKRNEDYMQPTDDNYVQPTLIFKLKDEDEYYAINWNNLYICAINKTSLNQYLQKLTKEQVNSVIVQYENQLNYYKNQVAKVYSNLEEKPINSTTHRKR